MLLSRSGFLVVLVGAIGAVAAPASAETTIALLVPPSFRDAFGEIAAAYEKAHAGTKVTLGFGASKIIFDQLDAGAEADLAVMTVDIAAKSTAIDKAIPVIVDRTALVAVTGGKVKTAKDLAKPGVRLSWGSPGAAMEKFDDETLANLTKTYGAGYAKAVRANVLVHKSSPVQAEQAVEDGTVDAAIVLASNTTAKITTIPLGKDSVDVVFAAGVVKASKNAEAAREIIALAQSPTGQAILKKYHQALGK